MPISSAISGYIAGYALRITHYAPMDGVAVTHVLGGAESAPMGPLIVLTRLLLRAE